MFAEILIAVAVVVVAARLFGLAVARLGQPQVMGEIVAGIVLGPSILGAAWPEAKDWIFPAEILPLKAEVPGFGSFETLGPLGTIAQLGLIFFMFLVGLELDPDLMRGKGRVVGLVSGLSLLLPFALGVGLAVIFHDTLAPDVELLSFSLFVGAALAITAFPVLARILQEKDLTRQPVGAISLACAAIQDVLAWLILAVVVAIVAASGPLDLVVTLALTAVFAVFMILVVKPGLAWLVSRGGERASLGAPVLTVILVGVVVSAYATEEIGIHAIFGAFIFGAVMPRRSRVVDEVTLKLEDFTVLLFLPVFFAITGLQTELAAIDTLEVALVGLLVLAAAIAGKVVGGTVGARLGGLPRREASVIGILMNTRGLTELVILSVGRGLGVVPDALFAILVMVALITTFMTSPLIDLLQRRPAPTFRPSASGLVPGVGPRRILVALDGSAGDAPLAALAGRVAEPTGAGVILARVLEPPERLSRRTTTLGVEDAERRATERAEALADRLRAGGTRASIVVRTENDSGLGVCRIAESEGAELVLAGAHRGLLPTNVLGGSVATLLERCPADLAIYVDPSGAGVALERGDTVLAAVGGSPHELAAAQLGARLASASGVPLVVLTRDPAAEARLAAAGGLEDARLVAAGDDPRASLSEAIERAGVLLIGVGDEWGLEPQSVGASRARLISGLVKPAIVVRQAAGAQPSALKPWLKRARQSQVGDWLGSVTGRVPATPQPRPSGT